MKTSGSSSQAAHFSAGDFILAGAAGVLLWRRVTYRRIDRFPEQLPALVVHSAT
jgi:hypothetical protein